MRIAIITAGAGGMYCGSCMKDNALAVALGHIGHEAVLVPTYTPITTDEPNVSRPRVFLGGVNVYLQNLGAVFRHLPGVIERGLNTTPLLRWAGGFVGKTDYTKLGPLTISMLSGRHGKQRKEIAKLAAWLKDEIQPDVVVMTNALLSGCVPVLQDALNVPIWTTLQGDDVFLDAIFWRHKEPCLEWIRKNDAATAGYLVTSSHYADHMAYFTKLDRAKMHAVPIGLNPRGHLGLQPRPVDRPPTLGYFARFDPVKGFHNAVTAYLELKKQPELRGLKFRFGGWQAKKYERYTTMQVSRMYDAGHREDVELVPCPDLGSKARFFQSIDVLSTPVEYLEPKGLYVLEAWANGVPVVQPNRGNFPELLERTGGGVLYEYGATDSQVSQLASLLTDLPRAAELGRRGHAGLHEHFTAVRMAEETLAVLTTPR